MSYLEILVRDLSDCQLPCEYWDVRVEDSFETSIDVVNQEAVTCTSSPALGAFVRVRKNGFWFYEATTEITKLKDILNTLAQGSAIEANQTPFTPSRQEPFEEISCGHTKFSAIPLDEKLELVQSYASVLHEHKKMGSSSIRYRDIYKVKSFLNNVGTRYEYDFNQGGMVIDYTLKDAGKAFEDRYRLYGAEFDELRGHEPNLMYTALESEEFLNAPAVVPGKYRVLLDPEVAGVFTHESFGHKSEADFMLGDPEAIEKWKLGTKIAADCLTIVDYGGHKNTSGYCPVDDDGVPAKKNYLIKNGILTGRLHSTDTAGQIQEETTGNSRAMNFEWEPIVRMTSTYIEAGSEPVSSIMKRCEGAIMVQGVKHGSGLSTFTIAPNRGYFIQADGSKKPVRLTVISGSVFETLKNVEAISSDFHLKSSAVGGCGKAEQWPLPVADGGPFVLVKEMQVS